MAGRPCLLTLTPDRRHRLWDLALDEPTGPPLPEPAGTITARCVGPVHGRAVFAAGTGELVHAWDVRTGREIPGARLDRPALAAVAVGDGLCVVDAQARITPVRIPVRAVHPLWTRS
jgi:hypothetical protein